MEVDESDVGVKKKPRLSQQVLNYSQEMHHYPFFTHTCKCLFRWRSLEQTQIQSCPVTSSSTRRKGRKWQQSQREGPRVKIRRWQCSGKPWLHASN